VRRGVTILEDAFHTASLPWAHGGRLVIVRSLSVGKIHPRQSSASVAIAIERSLRGLSSVAVHAESPNASAQPAVYFRDDAEPLIRLAVRLARGETPSDWFWPLAARPWKPGMDRQTAIAVLFGQVMRTNAGPAAGIHMMDQLVRHHAIDSVLSSLEPASGNRLLGHFGWAAPSISTQVPSLTPEPIPETIHSRWRPVLQRWIARWAPTDARSVWLAAVALTAERPGRVLDANLIRRAERLVTAIADTDRVAERERMAETVDRRATATADEEIAPCIRRSPSLDRDDVQRVSKRDIASPEGTDMRRVAEQDPSGVVNDPSIGSHTVAARENAPPSMLDTSGALNDASAKLATGRHHPPPKVIHSPAQLDSHELILEEGLHFSGCGLFFLVPLMVRLGIESFLRADPRWIEDEFPIRLLCYVARQLEMPADDLLTAVFEVAEPESSPDHIDFVAPTAWREWLFDSEHPWQLSKIEGSEDVQTLLDASGEFVLAHWRGSRPKSLSELLQDTSLTEGPMLKPQAETELVFAAWLAAIRGWCRRYAEMELEEIVCRPGHIVWTPTHIDVSFDQEQVDVRIRKAGLDIDPGWVPWLGRVIYFHYLYGASRDG